METSREQSPGKAGQQCTQTLHEGKALYHQLCSRREYRTKTRNPGSSHWSIQKLAILLPGKTSRVQVRRKGLPGNSTGREP